MNGLSKDGIRPLGCASSGTEGATKNFLWQANGVIYSNDDAAYKLNTKSVGGGQKHSQIPVYFSAYFYKRTK